MTLIVKMCFKLKLKLIEYFMRFLYEKKVSSTALLIILLLCSYRQLKKNEKLCNNIVGDEY